MALGLVGEKIGMTRVFAEDGNAVPVTVIEVKPNRVTQVKTANRDGYTAVQVTTGTRRPRRVTKAQAGHFAKAGVEAGVGLWEFRVEEAKSGEMKTGSEITVSLFTPGQMVDVQGISQGKGFAGVIKRHHFGGGRATHGNSLSHRAPGSIGQRQDPGRVFPGKKMAGQMGNVTRTQRSLEVARVDAERNLLLIKGSVPGPRGAKLIVRPAVAAPKAAARKKG
jgi:large subunit ribosomal protein L3